MSGNEGSPEKQNQPLYDKLVANANKAEQEKLIEQIQELRRKQNIPGQKLTPKEEGKLKDLEQRLGSPSAATTSTKENRGQSDNFNRTAMKDINKAEQKKPVETE